MPRVEATVVVDVPIEVAFGVSQTQGEIRYRWDNFVRSQQLLDGAPAPAAGVRTRTVSRHGLRMTSEYTSFRPPRQVGMKMVTGPPFFRAFGGGWSFRSLDAARTEATWRYTFTIRPRWLSPIGDRVGVLVLGRDIRRRIAGFARGCADPVVVASVRGERADPA